MNRSVLFTLLFCGFLGLAACESSEERAEQHFQDGVALLETGDVDRALVEFRNVFRLNGQHKEARRLYAQAEVDRGNLQSGYSQYLRLIEQYPDDIAARRELTRLALARGEWSEVERHAPSLIEADASDQVGRLADLSLRYREAIEAEDAEALAQIAEDARALRETMPDEQIVPELLADYYAREGRREEALEELSRAIELADDDRRLYTMRLALLQEMGDLDAVESNLLEMVELFPDDPSVPAVLIRWYLSQDRIEEAEAFMRERAAEGGEAEKIDLVRFLVEYRGRATAIEELDRLMAEGGEDTTIFRSLRAGLSFEGGDREDAIAELQSIVDSATEETDRIRNVKVALAQMLQQTGNSVGARALIEDVLSTDAGNVEANKMRAAWLIEADETDEAILTLRTALEQNPRDPSLMTLMAQAYERAGNRALMGEMLSLAVEVSNRAPSETMTYARYLIADGKQDVAERALVDSLRLNPGNADLLRMLGSVYVNQGDWPRAEQVVETLAGIEGPEAASATNSLRAQVLAGQGRSEEVVGFLEQLVESGEGGFGANVAIIRARVQNGEPEAALSYVEDQLAATPEDPTLRFLRGAVLEILGRPDEAEAEFSTVVEERPNSVLVWRALYLLHQRQGESEEAETTLDAALDANPNAADLLWIRASELQREGDLEAALDIYARMYEQNSSAPVVANNYASLLTTLRDDEDSIQRAYMVARRLQGLEVPAFQDTFGWIAYLRGDYEMALEHLEPAAEALSDDPSVQYHVAMAYEALGRTDDARGALQRAIDLGESGVAHPDIERARQKLADLDTPSE